MAFHPGAPGGSRPGHDKNLNMLQRNLQLSASAMLFVASLSKVAALVAWHPSISDPDPILRLPTYQIYIVSLVIETCVAIRIFFSPNGKTSTWSLVWLAAVFSVYHAGALASNVREPCPCIGNALEFIPILKGRSVFISRLYFLAFLAITISISIMTFDFKTFSSVKQKQKQKSI